MNNSTTKVKIKEVNGKPKIVNGDEPYDTDKRIPKEALSKEVEAGKYD